MSLPNSYKAVAIKQLLRALLGDTIAAEPFRLSAFFHAGTLVYVLKVYPAASNTIRARLPHFSKGFSLDHPWRMSTHALTRENAMEGIKMKRSFIKVPTGKTKLDTIEMVAIKNPILQA